MNEVDQHLNDYEQQVGELLNFAETMPELAICRRLLEHLKQLVQQRRAIDVQLAAAEAAEETELATEAKAREAISPIAAPSAAPFVPFALGQPLDDDKMQKVIQSLLHLLEPADRSGKPRRPAQPVKYSSDFWKSWDQDDAWTST